MKDVRRLAGLEEFAKFFDFVINPEEYRALIEDAKQTVKEWEQANVTARKIKDVDEWRRQVEVEFAEKEENFKLKQESAERRQKAEELRQVNVRGTLDKSQKEIEETLKQVEEKLAQLSGLEKREQSLKVREQDLQDRKAAFDLLDSELKQRVAKFAALVKE